MKKDKKRFEKIYTDPKFKPIPKKIQKVELKDNRFEAMFKNKDFISSTGIDEYGRTIDSKKGNINIEDYYIKNDNKKKNKKKKKKMKLKKKIYQKMNQILQKNFKNFY